MQPPASKVQTFFEQHQFSTRHLLCSSDCETVTVAELLGLAGMSASDLLGLRLGYTRAAGDESLRAAIAELYGGMTSEQIISLASPMEGLYLTARGLVQAGDHVVVQWPAFSPLLELPRMCGAEVTPWPVRPRGPRWEFDLDELEALLRPDTRMIVTTFPDCPTGFVPSQEFLIRLGALADRSGAWILADEIFRGIERGPVPPSMVDLHPRAIVLGGMSKVFGLPGLRAGWLAIPDQRVRQRLLDWRAYTSQCSAAPAELLALAALRCREALIQRNRDLLLENQALAESFFERWESLFIYRRPTGGTTAFVEVTSGGATELCRRLAREASIMLLPSSCYEMEDRFVRFGFGRRGMAAGLEVLDSFLGNRHRNDRSNIALEQREKSLGEANGRTEQ